jgi:uncharacterized protein
VADVVDIVVEELPDEGQSLRGQVALELALDDDAEYLAVREPVSYDLHVSKLGSTVTVHGRVDAVVETECSRCARRFEIPIDRTFDVAFVTADVGEADHAVELDESDLDLDYYGGDVVDGLQLLAEQILLEIPMKVLCAEDCKGLCPACGTNLNETDCDCEAPVDARWASLKDLRDRL